MTPKIFVSYRRSDSQHAAFAVADRLAWAFGHQRVFFDRSSIAPGAPWPDSLRAAVCGARVVIVIIGSQWLRVADSWGRRRLDDANDWVRQELVLALSREHADPDRLTIIPVYLDGVDPPPRAALDAPLQELSDRQGKTLSSDRWEESLENLIEEVKRITGYVRINGGDSRNPNGSPARPPAEHKNEALLDEKEIRERVTAQLSEWSFVASPHIWGVDGYAEELSKMYRFGSFQDAVKFMAYAAPRVEQWQPQHHPRWENQWKVVTVFFGTWDVGCRVTELDFKAAKEMDKLYDNFVGPPRGPNTDQEQD